MIVDYKPLTEKKSRLNRKRLIRIVIGIFVLFVISLAFIPDHARRGYSKVNRLGFLGSKQSNKIDSDNSAKSDKPENNENNTADKENLMLSQADFLESPISPISALTGSVFSESEEENSANLDDGPVWHTVEIKNGDTLGRIFKRMKLSNKDLHEMMTADKETQHLTLLQPGQNLKLLVNDENQVHGLELGISPGNTLHIRKLEEGFQVDLQELPLETQVAFGKGEIKGSLFSSGRRAGLDQNIIGQMVEIFGWDIDFALDLQPKDTFRVLFEEKCLEGERIDTGHILAAEIVTSGKKYQAVRYTDKAGQTSYFSPDGSGMHQAFLRSPVNNPRVSSHFGVRNHPILHKMRQHKGVDYAAPKGTPVQATADAKVVFAGRRGGYGNVIELQHGPRYKTLYAHLSRFANLRVGAQIKQGQVIGYVGSTGLATAPHLHYEFHIDGIHRDPLTVALPKKTPLPEPIRQQFIVHAKEMLRLLDQHEQNIKMARNEFPRNE